MKAKYDRDVWTLPDDVKAKRKQEEEERLATSAFMMHFKNKTAFVGKDGTNAQLINVNALTRSKGQMITNNDNYSNSFVDTNPVTHQAASSTEPEITSNTNKSENNMYNKANLSQGNSPKSYGIVAPGKHNARRKAALRVTTKQTSNCHENINNVNNNTAPLKDDKDKKWEDRNEQSSHSEEMLSKQREYVTMMHEENLNNVCQNRKESLSMPSPFATEAEAAENNNKKQQVFRLPLLPYHLVHDVNRKVEVQSLKRMAPSHIESKSDNKEYYVSGGNARVNTVGQQSNLYNQKEVQEEEYQNEEKEESWEESERLFSTRPLCAAHENIEHLGYQRHSLSFQPTGFLWKDAFAHEDEEKEDENNNNNIKVQRQKREKELRRLSQKERSTESAPLRLQTTKYSTSNDKNKMVKVDKKINTKSNKTKMSNANNVREPESTSHHTPNSKVIYTPYSLEDYRAMMNKIANTKFGGLGPSDSDEQRRARERKLREREYGMQAERQAAAALALQVQSKKDTNTNQEVHHLEQEELEHLEHEHQVNNRNGSNTNKHITSTKDGNSSSKEKNVAENFASERVLCEQSKELLEKSKWKEDHEQEVELEHHNVEEKPISKAHLRQPTPKQVIAARKRRERALQYGLQAASNLQKSHQLINNNGINNHHDNNANEMCAGGVTQQADKRVKDADVIAAEKRALLLADLESEHEQKKNAVEMIRRQLRT